MSTRAQCKRRRLTYGVSKRIVEFPSARSAYEDSSSVELIFEIRHTCLNRIQALSGLDSGFESPGVQSEVVVHCSSVENSLVEIAGCVIAPIVLASESSVRMISMLTQG